MLANGAPYMAWRSAVSGRFAMPWQNGDCGQAMRNGAVVGRRLCQAGSASAPPCLTRTPEESVV